MKAAFLARLPALAQLKVAVERAAKDKGTLRSLDGAPMKVRSQHSALNTLLQGAGALVMKKALIELDYSLRVLKRLVPGRDYEFVANIHDEWQIECVGEYGDLIGEQAVKAIRIAGTALKMRCPLAGEYKTGRNWAETH
jgi:DNA polymerase I-like protein with 3'-5' exonuclease and polymerase domains